MMISKLLNNRHLKSHLAYGMFFSICFAFLTFFTYSSYWLGFTITFILGNMLGSVYEYDEWLENGHGKWEIIGNILANNIGAVVGWFLSFFMFSIIDNVVGQLIYVFVVLFGLMFFLYNETKEI